jgi:hypothetical protein
MAVAVAGVITEKTVNAFDPIVDLIQGLSYPIGKGSRVNYKYWVGIYHRSNGSSRNEITCRSS